MANEINGSKLQGKIEEIAIAFTSGVPGPGDGPMDTPKAISKFAYMLKQAVKDSTSE